MSKEVTNMDLNELREACRDRGMAAEETAEKAELVKRIILFDAGMKSADLPPVGYKRDEELSKRTDALEEKIETEAPEVYPIDPKVFEEDREILYKSIDQQMVEVTNKQKDFIYAWTYYLQNSVQVWAKRALGWRVVKGTDPECIEHKEVDGTRRIGDTLLMRIPRERYEMLEADAIKRKEDQHKGVGSRLLDLAERGRSHGLKVHEDLTQVRSPDGSTLMDVVEKRSGAHKTAMKHIDKKLRDGDLPGMPAPTKE